VDKNGNINNKAEHTSQDKINFLSLFLFRKGKNENKIKYAHIILLSLNIIVYIRNNILNNY
jgi:hypothetical protein